MREGLTDCPASHRLKSCGVVLQQRYHSDFLLYAVKAEEKRILCSFLQFCGV